MKLFSVLFALTALFGAVSGATCSSSLSKTDCDKCTAGTHLFGCNTCQNCVSDSKACTTGDTGCAGKGFVTEGTKCLKCTAIAGCSRRETSCSAASAKVTTGTNRCGACDKGYQKMSPSGKDELCIAVGIANCDATSVQTCAANTDKNGCENTKRCTTCKDDHHHIVGADAATADLCVAITAIAGCAAGQHTCTTNTAKTGCKADTIRCGQCKAGYQKMSPSGKNDVCVAVGIANCGVTSAQTCAANTDNNGCENTKRCTTCKDDHHHIVGADAATADLCVAITAIAGCAPGQHTCTTNTAKTGCKADTIKCANCLPTFYKKVETSKSDQCLTCASSSKTCTGVNAACTTANSVYTKDTTCVACGSSTAVADCVEAKCGTNFRFAWNKCRVNSSLNIIKGRSRSDIASTQGSCDYARSSVLFSVRDCEDGYKSTKTGEGIKECKKCDEATCLEGTCNVAKEVFGSGKCSAPGSGGNGTGNNTNSTGITVVPLAAGVMALLVTFFA